MRTTWMAWAGAVTVVAALAGCGAGAVDAEATANEESIMGERPAAGSGRELVERARVDLAQRLGVTAEQIEVASVEEVTWRDTSIGCPQPGMMYAQRLVNGSRIVLRAGGAEYHYHAGGGREPFYCERPQPPAAGGADV